MTEADTSPLLARKLRGQSAPAPEGLPMAALARVLGTAARDAARLDLQLSGAELAPAGLAELVEPIVPSDLLIGLLLRGDLVGFVVLDPALRCAVVESLTLGRISASPPVERAPSRADAALAGPLLERFLGGLSVALQGHVPAAWGQDVSLGAFYNSRRALELALPDSEYLQLSCNAAIADEGREGSMRVSVLRDTQLCEEPAPSDAAPWADQWSRTLMGAPLKLHAVLGRIQVPLGQVRSAQVGQVLPLGDVSVASLRLETTGGALVARARLGQMSGHRAIRVEPPADPQLRELAAAGSMPPDPAADMLMAPDPLSDPLPGAGPDAGDPMGLGAAEPALDLGADPLDASLATDDLMPLPESGLDGLGETQDLPDVDLATDLGASAEIDSAGGLDFDAPLSDLGSDPLDDAGGGLPDLDLSAGFEMPDLDLNDPDTES